MQKIGRNVHKMCKGFGHNLKRLPNGDKKCQRCGKVLKNVTGSAY